MHGKEDGLGVKMIKKIKNLAKDRIESGGSRGELPKIKGMEFFGSSHGHIW